MSVVFSNREDRVICMYVFTCVREMEGVWEVEGC